eukprot:COSAG01_NODE_6399_length_3686_cov_69.468506_4_plen_177_part_00
MSDSAVWCCGCAEWSPAMSYGGGDVRLRVGLLIGGVADGVSRDEGLLRRSGGPATWLSAADSASGSSGSVERSGSARARRSRSPRQRDGGRRHGLLGAVGKRARNHRRPAMHAAMGHADLRTENSLIQIYFIMGEKHACCAEAEYTHACVGCAVWHRARARAPCARAARARRIVAA